MLDIGFAGPQRILRLPKQHHAAVFSHLLT
jgi:hypothetical protein